jgi:hypothetical protein
VNVEVLQSSSGRLPRRVKVGERVQFIESFVIDFVTRLTNTPQQSLSRCAEGSVLPTGVLFARVTLPPLQDPLQGVIHDPPAVVELRYEPI